MLSALRGVMAVNTLSELLGRIQAVYLIENSSTQPF